MKNPAPVWRLKVELLGVAPTVWRRFDTHADVKLSQLHYFIQGAMGWELMHLFSYQDGHGYDCQISSEVRLCNVCHVGDALTYTYDFGDHGVVCYRRLDVYSEECGNAGRAAAVSSYAPDARVLRRRMPTRVQNALTLQRRVVSAYPP